jgi:hypothetical protein
MNKLEDVQCGNFGFWGNRHLIIRLIRHLTIVVDQKTKEVVAFYIIRQRKSDNKNVIDFMQVFDTNKGLGTKLVQRESYRYGLCVEEAIPESVEFWRKMGIPYEKVTKYN